MLRSTKKTPRLFLPLPMMGGLAAALWTMFLTAPVSSSEGVICALANQYGSIREDQDINIKFSYFTALESCPSRDSIEIVHKVENLHDEGGLVFRWDDSYLSRTSKHPLLPGRHTVNRRSFPAFKEDKISLIWDSIIWFSPSLKRSLFATSFEISAADLQRDRPTGSRRSSFKTWIIDEIKGQVPVIIEWFSDFEDERIGHNIFVEPGHLRVGIGINLGSFLAPTQEFGDAVEKIGGTFSEVSALDLLSDFVQGEELPKVFLEGNYWLIDFRNEFTAKVELSIEFDAAAAHESVAPIIIFDAQWQPVATGALSVLGPSE